MATRIKIAMFLFYVFCLVTLIHEQQKQTETMVLENTDDMKNKETWNKINNTTWRGYEKTASKKPSRFSNCPIARPEAGKIGKVGVNAGELLFFLRMLNFNYL
jgi:hypothetical protein